MAATCRYRYDPLDRLATCAPTGLDSLQRFYCQNRLATEIQGVIQRSFLQAADRLLAQHQTSGPATLLTTDQQGSVLNGLTAAQQPAFRYTPYGLRQPQTELLGLSGFNGERPDPVTGHYLLGNGYRAFNPVLMRFNSPDNLSPFGDGGLNAYAYCVGDPVNRVDPTGHMGVRLLVAAFKATARFGRSLPKVPDTKHPILFPRLKGFSAKTIKGDISVIVSEREAVVNRAFNVQNVRELPDFIPEHAFEYDSALREARTLTPQEQIVKGLQSRPLPLPPEGRVVSSRTSFALMEGKENVYDLPWLYGPKKPPIEKTRVRAEWVRRPEIKKPQQSVSYLWVQGH